MWNINQNPVFRFDRELLIFSRFNWESSLDKLASESMTALKWEKLFLVRGPIWVTKNVSAYNSPNWNKSTSKKQTFTTFFTQKEKTKN